MDKNYAENGKTDNVIELGSPARPSTSWSTPPPREVAAEDWQRFSGYVAEIFGAFGMDLDTPGTRDTPERYLQALYRRNRRLRGRAEAADLVPGRGSRRRVVDEPDHRGPDRLPEPVRAPCAPVPRLRPHRLHRCRPDHRHLQADASRASVRPSLHRAGAARRADRRRARRARLAPWRRRASRGVAPLHADARRRGALAHDHHLLARRVRRSRATARVPRTRSAATAVTEPWPSSRSSAAEAGRSAVRWSRRSSPVATPLSSPTVWPTAPRRRASHASRWT